MAELSRRRLSGNRVGTGGPYEAIVVNHLDPMYMGSLEVELLRNTGSGNNPERTGQLHTVRYLSPFYGVTPQIESAPNDGYEWTQKSYGMWFVPPDVGTKVLVIFAEENAAYGYWIGCVQDTFMNFMLPDGRASTELTTEITPGNLRGKKLPVGEYNKKVESGLTRDPTLFSKPYNKDFTQVLEIQGLLDDEARGTTTTSARREIPSAVFGISTPGPLDKRPGAPIFQYGPEQSKAPQWFNRLGGSSLVFDDGDDKFIRRSHPQDGPPDYANVELGDINGNPTIPQNELVRLRTRTGHQILMHNSEDLIYIANSRGTAWIELTSDGKIDIHADDSISIMTANDLNITAERDINLEAGRNVNIRAEARWSNGQQFLDGKESGRVQIESRYNTNIEVGKDYKLTVKGFSDTIVDKEMKVLVKDDYHFHTNKTRYQRSDAMTHETSGFSWYRKSDSNIHDYAAGIHFLENSGFNRYTAGDDKGYTTGNTDYIQNGYRHEEVTGEVHVKSGANIRLNAPDDISLRGGSLLAGDATEIHWNSGKAKGTTAAGNALRATEAQNPEDAEPVIPLTVITLPFVTPGNFESFPYNSILCRSPQHEPWPHHENQNPQAFKINETDREAPGQLPENRNVLTPDTFRKNTQPQASVLSSSVQASVTSSGRGAITEPAQDPLSPSVDRTATAQGQNARPGSPLAESDLVGNIDGFTSAQTAAYLGAVGFRESNNRYNIVNSYGFAGKYQFGTAALKEAGMIRSDVSNSNSSMNNPANWTGQYGVNSLDDWLNNVGNAQEYAMITYTNKNRRYLQSNGGIRSTDTIEQIGGMLMGSHLLGAGGMNNWRNGNGGADAYGTTGEEYFALGSAALGGTGTG